MTWQTIFGASWTNDRFNHVDMDYQTRVIWIKCKDISAGLSVHSAYGDLAPPIGGADLGLRVALVKKSIKTCGWNERKRSRAWEREIFAKHNHTRSITRKSATVDTGRIKLYHKRRKINKCERSMSHCLYTNDKEFIFSWRSNHPPINLLGFFLLLFQDGLC